MQNKPLLSHKKTFLKKITATILFFCFITTQTVFAAVLPLQPVVMPHVKQAKNFVMPHVKQVKNLIEQAPLIVV